jgi:ribosomal protein S18 acetylase RimI-like enzyme
MRIEQVTDVSAVLAAPYLFDNAPTRQWTENFLSAPGHHLLMAFDGDRAVGMVTGVAMTMPDKGTEMFLYELAVADDAQGRGIGTALARALADIARASGCYDMWVLTDHDNLPALGAYRRSGATTTEPTTMLVWDFGTEPADGVASSGRSAPADGA